MKKIVSLAALMLAVMMLAGCAAVKGEGFDFGRILEGLTLGTTDKPVLSTELPDGDREENPDLKLAVKNVLFWDHVRLGGTDRVTGGYKVFSDRDSFIEAFRGTQVDTSKYLERGFDDTVVIAVYLTTRTGGWTFAPESVGTADGALDIRIKASEPADFATQAFEDHVVLIAVSGSLWHEGMEIRIDCPAIAAADDGEIS